MKKGLQIFLVIKFIKNIKCNNVDSKASIEKFHEKRKNCKKYYWINFHELNWSFKKFSREKLSRIKILKKVGVGVKISYSMDGIK